MRDETTASVETQWARVRGKLRAEFGEVAYRSWLKPLTLAGIEEGEVRIAVPTRFMQDWVRTHYAERLRALWKAENKVIRNIEIIIATATVSRPAAERPAMAPRPDLGPAGVPKGLRLAPPPSPRSSFEGDGANGEKRPGAEERDDFGAPLDPRFTFDNFVIGKPNEFATAAARRVSEEAKVPFNPLFLYGGVGLGKTHLMHAIAWEIRKRHPQRKVVYLSAEMFMYRFIRALRFKDMMSFKEQFRSVDVLMIDDVQFISGKDSTQRSMARSGAAV